MQLKRYKIVAQHDPSLMSRDSDHNPTIYKGTFEPVGINELNNKHGTPVIIQALEKEFGPDLDKWSGGDVKEWIDDIQNDGCDEEYMFLNGDTTYTVFVDDVQDPMLQALEERIDKAEFLGTIPEDRWYDHVVPALRGFLTDEEAKRFSEDEAFSALADSVLADAFMRYLTR